MVWLGMAFMVTALIGVWAAYDQGVAWRRFVLIVMGLAIMLGVALAGRYRREKALAGIALGSGLLAGAIGAYFLLVYDWQPSAVGEFTLIQQAGIWIQGHRPALPVSEDINANVAGGILVLLLPLAVAGVAWVKSGFPAERSVLQGRPVCSSSSVMVAAAAISTTLALALAVIALILTGSRGAWIGLIAGAGVAAALGRLSHRRHSFAAVLVLACALLFLLWAAVALPGLESLLSGVAGGGSAGRSVLWKDMLALVTDYPFTGSGLGSTMMVYSTYVMLLHVGYITHAHNLFLQIAIEQGLPGLVAFAGLLVAAGWRLMARADGRSQVFRLAAIASLVALAVHGMVDAGAYASKAVPALFLPLGFAFGTTIAQGSGFGSRPSAPSAHHVLNTTALTSALVLTFALITAFALALLPASRAAFQANLGTLAQTRAELSRYQWPAWPIQDALRRSPEVDLEPADRTLCGCIGIGSAQRRGQSSARPDRALKGTI